jgi:hypothetical protein
MPFHARLEAVGSQGLPRNAEVRGDFLADGAAGLDQLTAAHIDQVSPVDGQRPYSYSVLEDMKDSITPLGGLVPHICKFPDSNTVGFTPYNALVSKVSLVRVHERHYTVHYNCFSLKGSWDIPVQVLQPQIAMLLGELQEYERDRQEHLQLYESFA